MTLVKGEIPYQNASFSELTIKFGKDISLPPKLPNLPTFKLDGIMQQGKLFK